MKMLLLGPVALSLLVVCLLAGCASRPAKEAPLSSGKDVTRQVVMSARYLLIQDIRPVAKSDLAFLLGDGDPGWRAGWNTLTKEQADAALVELMRLTGQQVHSTGVVSVAVVEDPEAVLIKVPLLRYPDRSHEPPITISGQAFTSRPNFAMDLEVSPQVREDTVFMRMEIRGMNFEGWVEYAGSPVKIPSASNGETGETPEAGEVKEPAGFFQPIFSESVFMAETRMMSGQTIVLRSARKAAGMLSENDGSSAGLAESPVEENILVFLTAVVRSVDR